MTEDAPYLLDPASRRFSLARPTTLIGRSPACRPVHPRPPRLPPPRRDRLGRRKPARCATWTATTAPFSTATAWPAPQPLTDGDQIAVASAVFTFRDPEATLREAAPAPADRRPGQRRAVGSTAGPSPCRPRNGSCSTCCTGNAGRPCTKQEIAQAVWPEYQAAAADYQVESLVKRLREKLEPDPRQPILLLTVPGRGYKLVID